MKILTALALAFVMMGVTTPTLAATSAEAIPEGFLLYEKAATKKDATGRGLWSVDRRKNAKLAVDPCHSGSLAVAGRIAARTVTYTAVSDQRSEQVILYSSTRAAEQALAEVRKALARCPAIQTAQTAYRYSGVAVGLGDEGLVVTGQLYQGGKATLGGERVVLVRRGNALVVYARSGEWGAPDKADFAPQTKDAERMLAKICQVARCS
ncbi:hypothetical protein AB0395_38675 [Streptosporangium sp. NPDC051023]|uniref:hypothetical protein n=1 Tax=Streptosporangium sp. NPDC051023 TaxID=3155410 RepID=UPI00344F3B28